MLELFFFNFFYAFLSRQDAKAKGVPVTGRVHQFHPAKNELTLEERKRKVAKLKERTICRKCGKRGHWQGDDGCPAKMAALFSAMDASGDGKLQIEEFVNGVLEAGDGNLYIRGRRLEVEAKTRGIRGAFGNHRQKAYESVWLFV